MIKRLRYKKWKKIIEKSGLFDVKYYLFTYPDVRLKDINPIMHYIKYGANEGRNPNKEFDTSFYLTNYSDVKDSKMNPLVHYILYGRKEGRKSQKVLNSSSVIFRPIIPTKINKKLIKSELINNVQKAKLLNLKKQYNSDLVVILHIYYPELIEEISSYLTNIKHDYVLVITYPKDKAKEIKSFLKTLSDNRIEIEVENYGYDIFPFLKLLPVLKEVGFKFFCKIHTKRDHDDPQIGKYWRESLLDGILGSEDLVNSIVESFEKLDKQYMVGSKLNYLSYQGFKYDNEKNIKILAKKLNLSLNYEDDFGFIAGTMFWGRVETFTTFSKIKIDLDSCESTSGQTSSIFHAFERIFGILSLENLNIGLVDYELKYNVALPLLELKKDPKPLLTIPKYRYKAFRHRHKYLEYLLIQKSSLLDAFWCYENNLKFTKNWEDCLILFIYNEIKYLSKTHKNLVLKISHIDDKMIIEYKNKEKEIVELKSNSLSANLNKFQSYDDNHLSKTFDIEVSIIVATYNHEKFIEEALESIVSQKTNFKFEVLVGDDCSTDKTPAIIQKMHSKHPDKIIPILRNMNVGVYSNFQELFNLARGRYIALNEGDDFWNDRNKLQIQVDYLNKHKECSVCYHPVKVFDEENREFQGVFPSNLDGNKFTFEKLFQSNIIQTNSVMYRNNVQKNQLLNPNTLPLDWFYHMQNSLYGEIHMIPKVMASYRKHEGGIWSKKSLFFRENSEGNILVFNKINTLSGQLLHNEIIARLMNYFSKLYWYYFEQQNIEKLFNLLTMDKELSNLFFKINNILINSEDIKDINSLRNKYQEIYKIDVVVTSYNHQNYIEQTLRSIIYQKGFFKLNIIIADDSSSDRTLKMIKNTLEKNKNSHNINILETPKNLGMLQNMKRAFKKVKGKYVAICEGDDYWISEEKIHKQLCTMLKNPSFSMCFNWLLLEYIDENYHILHPGQSEINTKHIDFDYIMQSPVTANFSCCFYKREVIENVPDSYFETKGNADWLFNLYIANQGSVGFLKDILSVYRVHSGGQWSGLSKDKQKWEMQNFYKQFKVYFPDKKELIEKCLESIDIK